MWFGIHNENFSNLVHFIYKTIKWNRVMLMRKLMPMLCL
ncbi:hypothetical protein CVS40_10968 [Lucilia cuprina]|nr:hypothetical protein CVS40_10968 [Lucilia cuprina]